MNRCCPRIKSARDFVCSDHLSALRLTLCLSSWAGERLRSLMGVFLCCKSALATNPVLYPPPGQEVLHLVRPELRSVISDHVLGNHEGDEHFPQVDKIDKMNKTVILTTRVQLIMPLVSDLDKVRKWICL